MMLLFDGITLPLEDPILKFLLILVIILAAPLLLNKLKIPYPVSYTHLDVYKRQG